MELPAAWSGINISDLKTWLYLDTLANAKELCVDGNKSLENSTLALNDVGDDDVGNENVFDVAAMDHDLSSYVDRQKDLQDTCSRMFNGKDGQTVRE